MEQKHLQIEPGFQLTQESINYILSYFCDDKIFSFLHHHSQVAKIPINKQF